MEVNTLQRLLPMLTDSGLTHCNIVVQGRE